MKQCFARSLCDNFFINYQLKSNIQLQYIIKDVLIYECRSWIRLWFWWRRLWSHKRKAWRLELVFKELNHFGVIADLFRQIGGHNSRFVLFCSFWRLFTIKMFKISLFFLKTNNNSIHWKLFGVRCRSKYYSANTVWCQVR